VDLVDLGLKGKVAVVTGASKGIGLAIVRALVEEGADVVAGALTSSPALDELAASAPVRVFEVDLATSGGPDRLVEFAGTRVDILVNNVGAAHPRLEGFLAVADEQWEQSLTLNLMAAVRASRAVLPGMLAAGRGVAVSIASVNADLPDPLVVDYGAAKAALVNWSKAASKEFGPRGVRFVTVHPGPVATDLWLGDQGVAARVSAAVGQSAEEVEAGAVAGAATRRFTQPHEVADLVVLLAGDRLANVTGTGVTIDGGLVPTL
jgi:NAD(P)-dependent dehydrogenase (short-subunit alcohol dehydrogenase family)